MQYILMVVYALLGAGGLALIKVGSKTGALISFADHKLITNLNIYAILGIISYGASFLLYTYLVSKFDLGYIIPISTALVYVFIFLFAAFFFGESFTFMKAIGIGLILAGVFVLNLYKG